MSTPLKERPDAPLGTLIFRAGLLPAETIENALEEGVKTGRRLGEILIERGLIKEEDLTRLLAGQKGLPFISVRERSVDPEAARLLAEDQARLFNALPIGFEDGVPVVALADPTNEVLNRNIREALGQEARFVVAARSELNDVITEVFNGEIAAPAPLTVDTSIPPQTAPQPELERELVAEQEELEPEAAAEPEPEAAALPEPEPEPMVAPEPEPLQFGASAYEPEPVAEPVEHEPETLADSDPEPDPEPEPEPLVTAYEAPAPEPAPAYEPPADPEPEFVPEPELAPEPEPAPLATEPVASETLAETNGHVPQDFEDDSPPSAAAASEAAFRVSIRLTSGERLTVAECPELGEAKGYAKALTKQLGATDSEDWPFVNGRFLKPDTIVSVDIEEI
jgi:Type II secretion system (T2SS), protein E, N-terminal domain